KWGFFSVNEYSRFYKTAYELKKSEFKHLKLMGSSVIDFEFHYTAHTLFNFFDYRFDAISSLLYVDRRGAPENTQLGFALSDKIALLASMVSLSPKTKHQLHITETNWPISGTAPYAPTSEHECVDEKIYGEYMLRYYLLALASQQVDSVSWHQLLARGYGLVDNVKGMRKREAFYIYKYMVQILRDAEFLRLDIKRDYYILQFMVNEQLLQIHWSLKPTTLKNEDFFIPYNLVGKKLIGSELEIGSSPIYLFITKEAPLKINSIG
ncbi:MAG: glycosyl hydrolase, partial [Campylobacterales bacterium]|nr:glycosyl hydrolase [Campylobacterales bacterium]